MKKQKPEPELNASGSRVITESFVKKLCIYQELYETPSLNEQLYLHYFGFSEIGGLDAYINVKSLWLENNRIRRISNLSSLVDLRCLFLQNNSIVKMENLGALQNLIVLNLSQNHISVVEGIRSLPKLEEINLSSNKIARSQDIIELSFVKSLKQVDLSVNSIADTEYFFSTFCELPNLGCLYLKGNSCVRFISNYRRTLIARLPNLNSLDDRPVTDIERAGCEAWYKNGVEAEKKVKREFFIEKEANDKRQREEFAKAPEIFLQNKKNELLREREKAREEIQAKRLALIQENAPDEFFQELNEQEEALNEPIDDDALIESDRKIYIYEAGELDKYGHVIKHTTQTLRSLDDLDIEELETILVENFFDFDAVNLVISAEFESSVKLLREKWSQHEESLR